MKKHLMSVARKIAGVILIIVGIFGLFLPFLQGILLILSGIFLLDEPLYNKVKERIKTFLKKKK